MNHQSMSDRNKFKECCKLFVKNDYEFRRFKTHPEIIDIIETTSYESGINYLNHILNKNKQKIDNKAIEIFKFIDKLGHPYRYDFGIPGVISPSVLRYYSIMGDIERLHGSLDDKIVVEIGSGYGAQSLMLKSFYNIKKYIIIDLPEVIELNKKYLAESGMDLREYEFYTSDDLLGDNTDIIEYIQSHYVISNFAFSECYTNIQKCYIEKILNQTENFYMLVNIFHKRDMLSIKQLKQLIIKPFNIINEEPDHIHQAPPKNLLLFTNPL